jgi:hypothetical protein
VYQGQKVHLFRPSLSFLAEAQQRLENRRGQKAEVRIKFFRRPQKLQTKDIIAKITNLFCIYLFQADTFINNFLYSIFYQLANKTRNLLHTYLQLHTYLHNLW